MRYFLENNIFSPNTFISIDHSCSVKAPFTWSTYADKKEDEILILTNTTSEEYLTLIPYTKSRIKHLSLTGVTKFVLGGIKQGLDTSNISKPKTIRINNANASLIFVDGIINGEHWSYTHYILEKPNGFYHFIGSSSPKDSKYANKIFRKIVESFKLLPKKEIQPLDANSAPQSHTSQPER